MRWLVAPAILLALGVPLTVHAGEAASGDASASSALNVETQMRVGPRIQLGLGYYAILPHKLLLAAAVDSDPSETIQCTWSLVRGPGDVSIERPHAPITWASVERPGEYVFKLQAAASARTTEAETTVRVYPPGEYTGNPILPGMFADPHVYYEDGKFYIYATSMENAEGAYGRGSVWVSEDFAHWTMRLTNWPEYGRFGGDIWAPDIIKKDGRYYLFVTRSGSYDTWVGVADHPAGPWRNLREDNTPIVGARPNAGRVIPGYNMDAHPFIDDDGQAYMYWGWSEAMAARLTPDLKNIDGPVHFLKGTKWLPDGGSLPQWLEVDLGESMTITCVRTSPEFRNVAYGYKIEVSEDRAQWRLFADRTANRTERAGEGYVDRGEARGRYVRITMTHCGGHWAGLYDLSVYTGDRLVSRDRPTTASTVRGQGWEPARAVDDSDGPYLTDFVEGAYMIKHQGRYYLLYSTGALHDGSYSVHYAIGEHPFGPFIMPPDNVLLRSNEAQTTRGPGHNSVLKYDGRFFIVYHQHNQPHVGAKGVFRQTCADRLEFGEDGLLKPVVPTQTGVGPLRPAAPQGEDIARGKYARASSVESGFHVAEYALDHNFASLWRAADNSYPQSLTVDLGGTFDIRRVETSFEYPTLAYRYKIETSLDGSRWTLFSDRTEAFPAAVSPHIDAGEARAA